MLNKLTVFAAVFVTLFLLDQATKSWTIWMFPRPGIAEVHLIPGFLSLVHAQNFGAAFSSLEGQQTLFLVFTVVATVIVLVGCYYGYTASGGPVGVGTATAKSMVLNIVLVHIIGMMGTLVFWGANPRAPIGG